LTAGFEYIGPLLPGALGRGLLNKNLTEPW
jgi:hypothetical protein